MPKPRNTLISLILQGPKSFTGMLVRYFILFPYRLMVLSLASAVFFAALPIVLLLKNEHLQRLLFKNYCKAFLISWGLTAWLTVGAQIRRIGTKPVLKVPHIFVANHTSIIDYIVLSAHDFPHSTVAQKQSKKSVVMLEGILGFFLESVLTLNGSLLFNRGKKKDRDIVASKIDAHVKDTSKSPLLIFPEGTCVNNEYTVLFKKGAFELDAIVAPVAIKYLDGLL